MKMKIPWRKNVLTLILSGYTVVLVIFIAIVMKTGDKSGAMSVENMSRAYDLIKEPLMALIGGSLAISKDLIPFGRDELPSSSSEEQHLDGGKDKGKDESSSN